MKWFTKANNLINGLKGAHLVIVLFFLFSLIGYSHARVAEVSKTGGPGTGVPGPGVPGPAAPGAGAPGSGVRINTTAEEVVLDNGILKVTLANPEGYVTKITYNGLDNLLDLDNGEQSRGYWDLNVATDSDDDGLEDQILLVGTQFKVINQAEDRIEISFLSLPNVKHQLQVDKRYIMLKGSPGFYSYAIFERPPGLPATQISQIRVVYRPDGEKFRYMAITDKIQREMPTARDRDTGQPLAYKEAVVLTNPGNPALKGEVDDKYEYALTNSENRLNGWVSVDPAIGLWIITPTDEYRMAGPQKRDLTSHAGPILLNMFHSTHYAGKDGMMSFAQGEPWKKVFGPFFVHVNSLPGKGDPGALWQKAKEQLAVETKCWPYDFPMSEDFPKANQRGSVVGTLMVNDKPKPPAPAASAWVGLAPPGNASSWEKEMKGYQFWMQTGPDGKFQIKNVRAGTYRLYAWVPGFIGDFMSPADVIVKPGEQVNLAEVVFMPPRIGPTLWEIGIPDRSANEFFVPDPPPNMVNPLFVNDVPNKFRQYGIWDCYSDLYKEHDLVYTVGKSDFKKDWFYAHVPRKVNNVTQPTTWEIVFPIETVAPNTNYTLHIALASANQAEVQVRVNQPDLVKAHPIFTTLLIGKDNAIARHGIFAIYRMYTISVPSALLHPGPNSIFLTQSRHVNTFCGVMYDYLRLEGPPAA